MDKERTTTAYIDTTLDLAAILWIANGEATETLIRWVFGDRYALDYYLSERVN